MIAMSSVRACIRCLTPAGDPATTIRSGDHRSTANVSVAMDRRIRARSARAGMEGGEIKLTELVERQAAGGRAVRSTSAETGDRLTLERPIGTVGFGP